jgi:hypothetical protein
MTAPRSNPAVLRALAHMARLENGLSHINIDELVYQLEAAATDLEILAEDLDMEREVTRRMAADIAVTKPPKKAP